MSYLSRREVLRSAAAAGFLSLIGCDMNGDAEFSGPRLREWRAGSAALPLKAEVTTASFRPGDAPSTLYTYGPRFAPVLRARRGEALAIDFSNALEGHHTSVHWHGIRLPNAMDGVPYLTQPPVQPGEHFRYAFTPPDAGTYFFHPHCETDAQLGRGLAGLLIVDGDAREPFDDELILVLKDWRLGDNGAFLPFLTDAGAGKAGTFGTLRTVNGVPAPLFEVPAGANLRIRILNADNTRIPELGVTGVPAALIAREGNAVHPVPFDALRVGPAMRVDLALRTPQAGETFQLVDYFAAAPVVLATFTAKGRAMRKDTFAPMPLLANPLPEPDLDHALRIKWALTAASAPSVSDVPVNGDATFLYADATCLAPKIFWAIAGQTWPPAGHEALPPPLGAFPLGSSVVIELFNGTPHMHPMHLHGHSFKVISASRSDFAPYWTDTVLVAPKERVEIAFVADNPGKWMVHCHIIEHQETGMMGWFRVA